MSKERGLRDFEEEARELIKDWQKRHESSKGGKLLDFDNLEEAVHEGRNRWHERRAFIKELLEEPEQLARKDPALGIACLFDTVTGVRDLVERNLYDDFGFESRLPGYKPLLDCFIRPERAPRNGIQWGLFCVARAEWVALEVAVIRMCEIIEDASYLDKDTFRALYKACTRCLVHLLGNTIVALILSPSYAKTQLHESVKSALPLSAIAGWVAAQTSLEINTRLKHSLEKGGGSASRRFIQDLPATTLMECAEIVREGAMPTKLVNSVTTHLSNAGSNTPEQSRDFGLISTDISEVPINESQVETFSAKERLETIRASSNITEREDQILEMVLETYSYKKIADELDRTVGTVKSTMSRVHGKLRQAAGQ